MEISATDLMDCLHEAEMQGRQASRLEFQSTILMLEESNITLQRANVKLYEEREHLTEQVRQFGLDCTPITSGAVGASGPMCPPGFIYCQCGED